MLIWCPQLIISIFFFKSNRLDKANCTKVYHKWHGKKFNLGTTSSNSPSFYLTKKNMPYYVQLYSPLGTKWKQTSIN